MAAQRKACELLFSMLVIFLALLLWVRFELRADSSLSAICDESLAAMPREKVAQMLREKQEPDAPLHGRTLFYYSAVLGHHDQLREWVLHKSNLTHVDPEILPAVAAAGDLESIRILVQAGISPDLAPEGGATALVAAAECGRISIMAYLIELGANIYAQNEEGIDALMESILVDNPSGVRLLLDSGYDINRSRTVRSLTPIEIARKKNNKEILHILRIKGVAH